MDNGRRTKTIGYNTGSSFTKKLFEPPRPPSESSCCCAFLIMPLITTVSAEKRLTQSNRNHGIHASVGGSHILCIWSVLPRNRYRVWRDPTTHSHHNNRYALFLHHISRAKFSSDGGSHSSMPATFQANPLHARTAHPVWQAAVFVGNPLSTSETAWSNNYELVRGRICISDGAGVSQTHLLLP